MGNDCKPDGNCLCSVTFYEASNLNAEQPTIDPTSRTRARPFTSPEEAEKLTYESYLRTMHQTSETNVNLDIVNLIPAMDQVLEDCMIGGAGVDQGASMEGMAARRTFKLIPNDLSIHSQVDPSRPRD